MAALEVSLFQWLLLIGRQIVLSFVAWIDSLHNFFGCAELHIQDLLFCILFAEVCHLHLLRQILLQRVDGYLVVICLNFHPFFHARSRRNLLFNDDFLARLL